MIAKCERMLRGVSSKSVFGEGGGVALWEYARVQFDELLFVEVSIGIIAGEHFLQDRECARCKK